MTATRQRSGSPFLVAALVLLGMLFSAGVARTQCPGVKVSNQTPCTITLCLYDASGVVVCQVLPPLTPNIPFAFPAGFVLTGVQTASGNQYPFPPQPPVPACTPCINMAPLGAVCCAVVCFDSLQCRLRLQPCAAPCLP